MYSYLQNILFVSGPVGGPPVIWAWMSVFPGAIALCSLCDWLKYIGCEFSTNRVGGTQLSEVFVCALAGAFRLYVTVLCFCDCCLCACNRGLSRFGFQLCLRLCKRLMCLSVCVACLWSVSCCLFSILLQVLPPFLACSYIFFLA